MFQRTNTNTELKNWIKNKPAWHQSATLRYNRKKKLSEIQSDLKKLSARLAGITAGRKYYKRKNETPGILAVIEGSEESQNLHVHMLIWWPPEFVSISADDARAMIASEWEAIAGKSSSVWVEDKYGCAEAYLEYLMKGIWTAERFSDCLFVENLPASTTN